MPNRPDVPASASAPAPAPLLRAAVAALAPQLGLLTELGERFVGAGHELALVGGPVRDAFLGRTSPDLDFTTDASPDQTLALIRGWADAHWEIGRDFGTIGLRKGPSVIEITTYRTDVYDRQSRKPEVAFGRSLADDLVRRDFTVNAMALTLPSLEFVDLHGGLADLAARRLRTPATPEESFADDPLRMMRAARFASQLGFTVADEVYAAMVARADTLAMVSAERVRDEFSKLLLSANPRAGLTLLVDSGLAGVFLPELPALRLELDEHHRHKDVYEHSLIVLEQAIALEGRTNPADAAYPVVTGPDLVLRLAALLHDIGKPATRTFESGGGVSFHHHELVGARLVTKRLKAMRYDKAQVTDVARLVELHLRFHGYGEGQWTDSAVRRYVTDAGPLLGRLHLLTRSDCTTRNVRKATRLARTYDELEVRIARLAAAEELAAIRPELDGNQIAAVLGIKPGPVLGEAYKFLLAVRLDEGPIGPEAAEARLRQWWAARG
ncbi:MAG: CCA tRNA nucleotidyltransferase [Actinomycetales bacterium]|nr:CCA tRNA nucleotidyltransferase [Candidatus Phosphoribacter baldrii]MBK6956958.1 CCA tRNA nucleotidyltransferase [Candidatus Phosphoribacter baldrii]